MNDTILGVIYGGIIGIITALIGLIGLNIELKNNRKESIKEKKEKIYLRAIELITRYRARNFPLGSYLKEDEVMDELWSVSAALKIYGTKEIYDQLIDTMSESRKIQKGDDISNEKVRDMEKDFIDMALNDLNTK